MGLEQRIYCRKECGRRKTEVIHIGQLKIPVEKVMAEASKQDLKKGIISAGETAVIKRYIEKKLKIKQSDIKEFTVLKKSVDARKKEQIFFIYQVDFFTENEKRVLSRYKKNDVTIKSEKKENYTAKCEAAAEKDTSEKIVIAGFGPAGLFAAYELAKKAPELKVAVFEAGNSLEKRKCPIDGKKIKSCINCKTCAIMSGFGGAGAFSDGKYNITNDFGGTLYEYIGKDTAIDLMKYVDEINLAYGGEGTKMYSTAGTDIKKLCIQNELKLLDASVRHLGTDINYIVLENLYKELKEKVEFRFNYRVDELEAVDGGYRVISGDSTDECEECIISVGRSGSKWMEKVCESLDIETNSNRVDLGVRVELPAVIFSHLTDELYESKIVYRTEKFEDKVRTFCMNPYGIVVNENTNGIVTVNGHSYEDPKKQTENTNFALLVAKHFSEPFKDSNGYGESIARLSNMLGGGVIVQRFGDLTRGRRSTAKRIEEGFVRPTLSAEPGDLSLVLPKRILDGIIEMIYALDKIAPGTANDDTLLYGVEVKFYNMEVKLDEHLETNHKGLYVIGDGSGVTHSLSHASASGVYVARSIAKRK